MRAVFEVEHDGRYRARIEPPHSVLGPFLDVEIGGPGVGLSFALEAFLGWLDEAPKNKDRADYGGNAHSLRYADGKVFVEHDYELFPPTRVTTETFRQLATMWRDFVVSGEKSRIIDV